jgi:5-methylcytosine-specific restriction enzyme A
MPGQWEHSTRKARLPADWPTLRQLVKRRAKGICEHTTADGVRCKTYGTDCDHITAGDDHRLVNLQWLCAYHHRAKSSAEGNAARPRERRPTEQHPGLA